MSLRDQVFFLALSHSDLTLPFLAFTSVLSQPPSSFLHFHLWFFPFPKPEELLYPPILSVNLVVIVIVPVCISVTFKGNVSVLQFSSVFSVGA